MILKEICAINEMLTKIALTLKATKISCRHVKKLIIKKKLKQTTFQAQIKSMKSYLHIFLIFQILSSSLGSSIKINSKDRFFDPVILNGYELPELIGANIDDIVAFMVVKEYDEFHQKWVQIPLQVDEKHWQDWNVIKNGDCRYVHVSTNVDNMQQIPDAL